MIQNVTVRVPWTDNGWCGKICNNPCGNNDCLRLRNIYENKNESEEQKLAGKAMHGYEQYLPCIAEGAAFMSPDKLVRTVIHPYKQNNPETHGHFLETDEIFEPYSLPSRPLLWTMKDTIDYEKYDIGYDESREPVLPFKNNWVQEGKNHKAIFDTFYKNILPNKSLVFAYAKQVPFVDDPHRVIIGVGVVEKVIPSVEYNHTNEKDLRSMTWETMICHSIRKNGENGFLIPYYRLMEYAENNSKFDIQKATVFASEDYHYEFSYATEWLSHDGTIDTLLRVINVFEYIQQFDDLNDVPCQKYINWCKAKLNDVWEDRGAYPGLGDMLYGFGVVKGLPIANLIIEYAKKNNKSVFKCVENVFSKSADFIPSELVDSINDEVVDAWKGLGTERKSLFELLSRFSLNSDLLSCVFDTSKRNKNRINCCDKEILENPYILYELTRDCKPEYQIPVRYIDMAIFPDEKIQQKYPLAEPSKLKSGTDKRRIRALMVDFLERQSLNGHSLYPIHLAIDSVSSFPISPACNVTSDIVFGCKEFIADQIAIVNMQKHGNADTEEKAFQLERLFDINELIEQKINKRVKTKKPHIINEDWEKLLEITFEKADKTDIDELNARKEKIAILKELAKSRLSVLIGGAGTGKTTLLSLLCCSKQIQNEGILLLAPTGKARVKMMQAMTARGVKVEAKTVAQFLVPSRHFNFSTMTYRLSGKEAENVPGNVIIDESSMLTEEMFGALLEALTSAKRIILVGDPNQLPPIGTGRPFVDLVNKLTEDIPEYLFPRVGNNFGELKTTRRQRGVKGEVRFDVELANWYRKEQTDLDEDIYTKIQENNTAGHIVFKQWKTTENLENLLFETIREELKMNSIDDIENFNLSLGSTELIEGKYQYFNLGAGKNAENWQILTPVKNMPYGVLNLNHIIQQKYRKTFLDLANKTKFIPKRKGPESIVYGDKVICVQNEKERYFYKKNTNWHNSKGSVANGEIGIAWAFWNKTFKEEERKTLFIEYSSQPNIGYKYTKRDFGEETEAILELAYALTVHKAQGSEFNKVILIINEPCNLLSKELLYTAITRQVERLVILYNSDAYKLRDYSSSRYSEIARRFTRLFHIPSIAKLEDKYFAENLIHKTEKGELVRSKSEVIIANMLYENNIHYEYEKELILDGVHKLPDFTIEDAESGETWYWEHCGMMHDEKYRKKWEEKKKFYEVHGIIENENLIVTVENGNGFDSSIVKEKIMKFLK